MTHPSTSSSWLYSLESNEANFDPRWSIFLREKVIKCTSGTSQLLFNIHHCDYENLLLFSLHWCPFSFHNFTLNFTSRLQSTYFTIQRKFNPDLELLFTSAMCVNQPSLKPSNHRIKISVWTMTRPTWCSDSSGSRNTSNRALDYFSGKAEPREWEGSPKSCPTNMYKTDDKKFPGHEKIPGN